MFCGDQGSDLNIIERVEVIRGDGSSLYESDAIAGTINLMLRTPTINSYEFGVNNGLTGIGLGKSQTPAQDYSINFNTSLIVEISE
ncbi:MAG: TonB-dependent receptor plug domain-containing protein [Bacteroidales bacterium]|nr:TonB-dependent receptor plug domain-containing protein [Bacteroidales bacterium]